MVPFLRTSFLNSPADGVLENAAAVSLEEQVPMANLFILETAFLLESNVPQSVVSEFFIISFSYKSSKSKR
jgi:hypothetical protein